MTFKASPHVRSTMSQDSSSPLAPYHGTTIVSVRRGNQVIERFAVNLFDRQESNVRLQPTQDPESGTIEPADLRIGNYDVKKLVGEAPSRSEAWKAVLALALVVLVFEWYIYNRRVYL